jgi:hypothetical protein
MGASETRKPASGKKTGSRKFGKAGSTSNPEISWNTVDFQALRIVSRFRLSMPVARAVAEHAFGWRAA